MKIIFTKHVNDKLRTEDAINLGIDKKIIISAIKNPIVVNKQAIPHHSVGKFNDALSLSVIWKIEKSNMKVITFYVARKGRYENKIL